MADIYDKLYASDIKMAQMIKKELLPIINKLSNLKVPQEKTTDKMVVAKRKSKKQSNNQR